MNMNLEQIFSKIDFIIRYKQICLNYNDYDNTLNGSNKNVNLEILKKLDKNFVYLSKDRFFKLDFQTEKFELNFGVVIKDGLIEPILFYIKNNDGLLNNRFDFIAEDLLPGFREELNIPKYTSEKELEIILKALFSIYEDIKKEVIKTYSQNS